MNDPGLEDVISTADDAVEGTLRMQDVPHDQQRRRHRRSRRQHTQHPYSKDQEEMGLYQPTLWWFTSTAFPLIAGTFGPIANLFSVCALVQTWRVHIHDGSRIRDPPWLTGLNACSLFLALGANIALLFNFARRIPYAVAQPVTITLWYLSSILLAIPIGLIHNDNIDPLIHENVMAFSQSYYYGLISSVVYATISTLLLISTLGSTIFHRYPPSFSTLTVPQRTLMLQTISFSLYLALGAGIFASIENWAFADGIYWGLYTLLTIGLGTDFPLTTVLGRMLLIPYAAFGITLIGLVVSSVRGLVLERAKAKVVRRHLGKQREKWEKHIERRREQMHDLDRTRDESLQGRFEERRGLRLTHKLQKHSMHALTHKDQLGPWHRAEFELMRYIEWNAQSTERYTSLASSFVVILIVWGGGSLVFWSCEHNQQQWTYPDSLYFTYTTLLTIGYGDFYPTSSSGKPFFVLWSLISIPAMTVLISNMGDTVVKLVQDITVWVSKWTILPERGSDKPPPEDRKKWTRRHRRKHSRPHLRTEGTQTTDDDGHGAQDRGHMQKDLEHDIEHVGSRVEKFEEDEGTPNSLAARLAREISNLASDLSASPPKKYSWDEWTRWLEMLGEKSNGSSDGQSKQHAETETDATAVPVMHVGDVVQPPPKARSRASSHGDSEGVNPRDEDHSDHHGGNPSCSKTSRPSAIELSAQAKQHQTLPQSRDSIHGPPIGLSLPHSEDEQDLRSPGRQVQRDGGADSRSRSRSHVSFSKPRQNRDQRTEWEWTWLSDDGPLFSRKSETEWIMERLCFRLEEVLEDEIREARRSGEKRASSLQRTASSRTRSA